MKSPLKGSNGGLHFGSKFVGGPEMCFYWKIRNFYIFLVHFFFKFIRKTWANQFRGVRVLLAHSGVTKLENQCFLLVFPVLSPRSELKVLLRPRIGLPEFF